MDKQDVLLARQPIYNPEREVAAYELLFRDSEQAPISNFDGNRATSRVLLNLFTASDLATVTNRLPAFVNFTEELIHNPPLFDPESIVVEILEDIDVTPKLIQSVKALKDRGFTIALDDFVMSEHYRPLLELVDIIKLELPEMPGQELVDTVHKLKEYDVKLLAEKVETHEQFKQCVELGCDLFQGYFLSKPEDVKGTKMAGNKLAVMNLISELQTPEIEIQGLTQVITRDPSLSFNLLKLINSAAYRRSKEIESIHMAVTLMGIERIKSWASLLALSKINDKPQSLHYLALMRALMCEKLSGHIKPEAKDQFYTVGLLSCLDAFIDKSLEDIVSSISLDQEVRSALLDKSGKAGLALATTINFEQSHWDKINWTALNEFNLSAKEVNEMYYHCSSEAIMVSKS